MVIAALAALTQPALGSPLTVSNSDELATAIANARPGDEIILLDGTYSSRGATCATQGTSLAPIWVHAATPLGAKIQFDALEGFLVTGSYWQFEGLDVQGVCAADSNCEHAFHVVGDAHHFQMRKNRILDFNAQLKVNAAQIAPGIWKIPHEGLVEYNEVADTHPRNTTNPVTKLNIDTGDNWVVRGNYIHDHHKTNSDATYGAFMKSGGNNGLFERNLVICSRDLTGGVQVGLSFGGGGTDPRFCAPYFDPTIPCDVEHYNGMMRNNIIINCSDVGIYLNQALNSLIYHNTLIATTGIDFRFINSTGEAQGNVLASVIRARDGASFSSTYNLVNASQSDFDYWYIAPLVGDLRQNNDLSALLGQAPPLDAVPDDYCARPRGANQYDLGALQQSLGDCDTTRPPAGGDTSLTDGGTTADGGGNPMDAGSTADAGADGGPSGPPADAGNQPLSDGGSRLGASDSAHGCGCGGAGGSGVLSAVALLAAAAALGRRRPRRP